MIVLIHGHAKRPNWRQGSKVKVKHELHIARAHFVHFGPLKIHLLPGLQTHVQGYFASCELIFCILEAWKCDFFRVVKPMLQGYVDSCEHIFSYMATWKCDSFNSWTKFKGHAKRPNSWPGSKVKVKHARHLAWAHFMHFGALKIHLLPSLETHVQGYVASCDTFSAFWRLENANFAESWNPCFKVT